MVVVTPSLVEEAVKASAKLSKLYTLLERDPEVQQYLRAANVMAVSRLLYNDHGVVHSRIVAGCALEMLKILVSRGVVPSVVRDGVGALEDSYVVVLLGAYLHDVGNAVHRTLHHLHGVVLAHDIVKRLLSSVYRDERKVYSLSCEVEHVIFAHDESVRALTVEAGVVKVADGIDMAEGRARIPYKSGKLDIHAISALAIKRVEVEEGAEEPILIKVDMENEAGVFQVEEVLGRKVKTSGLSHLIRVDVYRRGQFFRSITF